MSGMHKEETHFYKRKAECVKSTSLPCYAPCAGRGALPIPRGVGRHRCARARDKAPLRGPLLAGAGAGWAGRGVGTKRWMSSPSRPSSNHCSVLKRQTMWTIWSIFWKQLLDFFTKWPLSGWQRTSQDGIFMIYVTLIRMFDRFLLYDFCFIGDNFLSWLILRVKIYWQFWYWTSAMAGHWITHNKHIVWQYPLPGVWYWRHL